MFGWLKSLFTRKGKLQEASAAELYGTPVPWSELFSWNGRPLTPIWGPEIFKEKLQTIRTLQELNRARHLSRWLFERNGNAQGVVKGLINYIFGKGSSVTVQGMGPDDEPPVRLTKQVKRWLTDWRRLCQWKSFERECYWRYLVDGECFVQIVPRENGWTYLKFIEPDSIVPPYDQNHEGPWSWGIQTDTDDTATPIAYNIRDWKNNTEVQVPAQFIKHLKRASTRNQKRGIPALYASAEELMGSQKLRHATREGQKVRSSIAYVREHAQAPNAAITALQDANMTGSYDVSNQDGTTSEVTYQRIEPGSVQDIPKAMVYKSPPAPTDSDASASCVAQSLQAVAANLNCPYWLVSGDSDSSSYAASLTAESPFVKNTEAEQDLLGDYIDEVQTAVVEVAIEQEILPEHTLDEVDLHITFPSPVVRNLKDETDRHLALVGAKLESPQTASSEMGLEYEREQANFAKLPPEPVQPLRLAGDPQTAGGQYKQDIGKVG